MNPIRASVPHRPGLVAASWIILLVLFAGCQRSLQPLGWGHTQFRMDAGFTSDSTLNHWLAPYRDSLRRLMDLPVARAAMDLPKSQPESPLGNLLTDLVMAALETQADAAILNYGGIRLPQLGAGMVTLGQFYELLPFDNYLTIVELDSAGLMELAEALMAAGGWPVSAEMRIDVGLEGVSAIRIQGVPIQSGSTFRIGMPDYVANGGDQFTFLIKKPRIDTGILLREACLQQARRREAQGLHLQAEVEGRITFRVKP